MDTAEIIERLSNATLLPREAILAAREKQAEMVPLFLQAIEDFLAGSFDPKKQPDFLFFAFHLLGEWHETSAYPTLVRLLRSPRFADALGDDISTVTSHRVIASVFDGDPAPLCEAILDPDADEFIRSRMCEALAMLVLAGRFARHDAAAFLQQCYDVFEKQGYREDRECGFVWSGWESAIALLGLEDIVPLVKQAFARGFVDPAWLDYSDFESDLRRALAGEPPDGAPGEFTTWDDCIEEFSHWYGFSEAYARKRALRIERENEPWSGDDEPWLADDIFVPAQASNPFRHVGRNDPCPCGSGAKFKKCCLLKAA